MNNAVGSKLILESDAEILFHEGKYFQENLIVLLWFPPFKLAEDSVGYEERLPSPASCFTCPILQIRIPHHLLQGCSALKLKDPSASLLQIRSEAQKRSGRL